MAEKQRVRDIIDKALKNSNINLSVRRKLNFEEEVDVTRKVSQEQDPKNISSNPSLVTITAETSPDLAEMINVNPSDFIENKVDDDETATHIVIIERLPSSPWEKPHTVPLTSAVEVTGNLSALGKARKVKTKQQYFDYLSDEEDFTAVFGDAIDSDTYVPSSDTSDSNEVSDTVKNKKKKKTTNPIESVLVEPSDQTELNVVGENGLKKQKINKKKERKSLKESGQAYIRNNGTEIPAKIIKPNPCIGKKCGNDCQEIPEERRKKIFAYFWGLTTTRRKDWIVSMTEKMGVKRKRNKESEKRQHSYKYCINEGEGKRAVCLKFLAATLDLSVRFIQYTIHNSDHVLSKEDARGKCEPHNKTKESTIAAVVAFIKSLPAVPSHYNRKKTTLVYLPSEMKNIATVYKFYKKSYIQNGLDVVSERVFRWVFTEKFNIGFHVPKKDKCLKCLRFEQRKDDPLIQAEKQQHDIEKAESYQRFKAHQIVHKNDPSTLCASFDLQKVLNTPYGDSMLLFYSRKLAVYNLCIYENGTRKVYSFYWDESNGKRGANEIGTIINRYIQIVDQRGTVKNLLLYSDCCPGQNRNRIILAMLHATLQLCENIERIQMNFLLTGHTYMPVDSVHAVIEKKLKNVIVYAPSQWYTIFSTARQDPEPYDVRILTYKDFRRWDMISDKYYKGNLTGKISKMRVVTFKKNKLSEITVKNSMNCNEPSYSIEVQPKTRISIQPCYKTQLPLSKAKHDDLLKLCRDEVIPEIFRNEYFSLTHANSVRDALAESDIEDEDVE